MKGNILRSTLVRKPILKKHELDKQEKEEPVNLGKIKRSRLLIYKTLIHYFSGTHRKTNERNN